MENNAPNPTPLASIFNETALAEARTLAENPEETDAKEIAIYLETDDGYMLACYVTNNPQKFTEETVQQAATFVEKLFAE